MPKIELTTEIQSTIEICFDLSRSIDLHNISTQQTNEQAIAGTTSDPARPAPLRAPGGKPPAYPPPPATRAGWDAGCQRPPR